MSRSFKVHNSILMLIVTSITLSFQNCGKPFELGSAVPDSGALGSVQPPALTDTEIDGKSVYDRSCLACHGQLEDSILRDKTAPEISLAIMHVPQMAGLASLKENGRDLEALEAYLASPMPCPQTQRVWNASRLTGTQVYYSLLDILGVKIDRQLLPVDGIRGSFQNNLELQFDTGTLESYLDFVSKSSATLLPAFKSKFVNCSATDTNCLRTGIGNFAQKVFRTTLTSTEIETLYQIFANSKTLGATQDEALTDVMTYVLVSPRFMYPFEQARTAGVKPSGREIANRLALLLWSSVPDDTLIARASDGSLGTEAGIKAQIDRMLKDIKGERFQRTFMASWAGLRSYFANEPASGTMPYNYQKETLMFFDDAIRSGSSATDLLNADHTFVNQTLANQYGFSGTFTSAFTKTVLPAGSSRKGLLTQGSFLSTVANATFATVYKRGNHVLKFMLCNATPPPPADVVPIDPTEITAGLTEAELARAHRNKSSTCIACHARMDPIGLSLSMFDQNAALKSPFAPVPGDLATMPDGTVLSDADELAKFLNRGSKVQSCFVTGLNNYVYAGYKNEDVRCAKESYHNKVNEGPKPLADWITAVVTDSVLKAN